MIFKQSLLARAIKFAAVAAIAPMAMNANALRFDVSDDLTVDIDTNISYGIQWRVDGRDSNLLSGSDINILAAQYNPLAGSTPFPAAHDSMRGFIQRVNSDDGTRNFDKWDQTSNRIAVISDIKIQYKNYGIFLRPQIWYDNVPFKETSWTCKYMCDPSYYPGGNIYGLGSSNAVASGHANSAKHHHEDYKDWGYTARFLDAYVHANWNVGEEGRLEARAGRQVISWGEASILQGGISSSQNRMDSSSATTPGVELKEIFLPTGALYASWALNQKLSFEAYWMYEFLPTEVFTTGSFFSMQDMITGNSFYSHGGLAASGVTIPGMGYIPLGAGGELGGAMTKIYHNYPDADKQWGFATRYSLDNGTEIGAYIVNYHDKMPSNWSTNALGTVNSYDTNHYSISNMENIRMYGLSMSTVAGSTMISAEYNYRANTGVVPACDANSVFGFNCKDPAFKYGPMRNTLQLQPGVYSSVPYHNMFGSWPARAEQHYLNVGFNRMLDPSAFWDSATVVGEVATWHIGGFDDDDLNFAHMGAYTKRGVALAMNLMFEYKNVLEGVDVTVPFAVNYGIEGSLSSIGVTEHNLNMSIGVEAAYLDSWRFGITYNDYSGPNNLWVDRDNLSVNVKYTF